MSDEWRADQALAGSVSESYGDTIFRMLTVPVELPPMVLSPWAVAALHELTAASLKPQPTRIHDIYTNTSRPMTDAEIAAHRREWYAK